MPSFKYRSESDSEPEEEEEAVHYQASLSDADEQGPDDTFHFRSSFSKAQRPQHHHQHNDSFMNDTSFQDTSFQKTEDDENMEQSYDTMQDDFLSDEDSLVSDEESEFVDHDPLAAAVRIEKKGTWLEQIEYTDRAVKRLKAIDVREAQQNTQIHWGGVIPDIKYSTEDLERDLFGDTKVHIVLLKQDDLV